ncbi:MAG: AI-2E family transporter, partial [Oscillospiraceae bacterium]
KEVLLRQGKAVLFALLPKEKAHYTLAFLRLTAKTFHNFIGGQCTEAVILGCMFVVSMAIFNFPYALLIGVLVGFTALVPIVGSFIGCAVGAFLIFMERPITALWFVILFLVLQQIEGNFIYPKVVGNSVGLPSMWVLIAVTVGGSLMGVVGMLIFIPVFSVVYIVWGKFIENRLKKKEITKEMLEEEK